MIKIICRTIVLVFLFVSYCYSVGFNDTVHFHDLLNTSNFRYVDFLQYSADIDVNSTDFYHWRISIDDLSDYQENGWQLMVDGHLLKPHIYGEKVLNQLALSSLLIDSIEIINYPDVSNGNFSDKGIIHIHTVKPDRGFNCYGAISAGNESGDPGPYKYTDRGSPNVDKIGYDNSGIIEYAYPSGWLRLSCFYQQHTFTDLAVRSRIKSKTTDWPGANKSAVAFDYQYHGKRWQHSVLSSLGSSRPYFLFIDAMEQEFPMQFGCFQWSYSGNRLNSIHWHLDYNYNQIRQCENAIESLMPYDQHTIDFRTEISQKKDKPLRVSYHFNGNIYEMNGGDDYETTYHQMNTDMTLGRNRNPVKIKSSFTYFNRKVAASLSILYTRKTLKKYTLSYSLSVLQRQLSLCPFYQFWNGPGKSIIEEYRIVVPDYHDRYSLYSGGIGIKGALLKSVRVATNITANYRHENWWLNIVHRNMAAGANNTFRNVYGGLRIVLSQQTDGGVNQKFSLRIKFGEHDAFNRYSTVKAVYCLSYSADRNFVLFLNSIYQNSEVWDFDEFSSETDELNPSEYSGLAGLDERIWFEAGFNKWCWQRRLLIRVAIQNLTNQQYRYHPLGMNREMSMIAGAYFWLDGR